MLRTHRSASMAFVVFLAATAALAEAVATGNCKCCYEGSDSFESGVDDQGAFVRALPLARLGGARRLGVPRNAPYRAASDNLARVAGATIYYMYGTHLTDREVPAGEFRGDGPLAAVKAFTAAAGLELFVAEPNLWVVRRVTTGASLRLILYARPEDPKQASVVPAERTAAIERALLDWLPVRDGCRELGTCSAGISYYWLPEEGPGTVLVRSWASSNLSMPLGQEVLTGLYKVRLEDVAGTLVADCLWSTGRVPAGPLVSGIREDLDGDGVRDFVFIAAHDYTWDAIVSGRSGARLLGFKSSEIAVSTKGVTPLRLAVEAVEKSRGLDSGLHAQASPVVVQYSEKASRFEPFEQATASPDTAMPAASAGGGKRRAHQVLATSLGGAGRIRVYKIAGHAGHDEDGLEFISPEILPWQDEVNLGLVERGLRARILFDVSLPASARAPTASPK